MKDLNYLRVNTSQDLPDIVWRRCRSGSPLRTVRQSTSALSTSVWYTYWRRCQALTVEVTQVAEAELMLRPWHCHVSSAEHLCTLRLRFSKQQSVWAWFLNVLKAGWVGLSNMQPSLSSEHSCGGKSWHKWSFSFGKERECGGQSTCPEWTSPTRGSSHHASHLPPVWCFQVGAMSCIAFVELGSW